MAHPRHGGGFGKGLKGGGNNGGYILGMCSCHSLVASYSSPISFLLYFWRFRKFDIVFPL